METVQQGSMGKRRFTSVDLLRGGGIAAILIIHRIHYTWTGMSSREELHNHMHGWMLPLLILAIVLFTMAGIFYFITGIANAYSMYNRVVSGKSSAFKSMTGAVSAGIILVVMNYVHRIFFMNGFVSSAGLNEPKFPIGLVTGFIQAGNAVTFRWSQVTEPGTLSLIGMVLIIVSLTLWPLLKDGRHENSTRIYRTLFVLSGVIFLLTPFLKWWLRPIYETSYAGGQYVLSFIIGHICLEFGMFPHLSFGFIGAIIGIALARNEKIKVFQKRNRITMFVLFLCGILGAAITQKGTMLGRWTIGASISMIELAMFILFLSILLKLFDFREKPLLDIHKYPAFNFRQFGMLALTVYTFEPVLAEIFKKTVIFVAGRDWTDNLALTTIFGICCLVLWNISLNLWRKIEFRASLEWTSAKILLFISGKRTSKVEFRGLYRSNEHIKRYSYEGETPAADSALDG